MRVSILIDRFAGVKKLIAERFDAMPCRRNDKEKDQSQSHAKGRKNPGISFFALLSGQGKPQPVIRQNLSHPITPYT